MYQNISFFTENLKVNAKTQSTNNILLWNLIWDLCRRKEYVFFTMYLLWQIPSHYTSVLSHPSHAVLSAVMTKCILLHDKFKKWMTIILSNSCYQIVSAVKPQNENLLFLKMLMGGIMSSVRGLYLISGIFVSLYESK